MSAAMLAATADSGDMPPATLLAAARKGDPRAFVAIHLPGNFFYWGCATPCRPTANMPPARPGRPCPPARSSRRG
ncbi:MAG TPA: hypothetical protein VGH25_11060 [Dongiaceae bacterium]